MKQHPDFFCEPHKLLKVNDTSPVLVALSGGADSCALLHLLYDASQTLGFPIYAAHVNHNIRTKEYGNEAARDEQFCLKLCSSLGIKLFSLSADVPAIARDTGTSLETAARNVRYSFFSEIMRQHEIKILATAHNADDNLETQIFNLARGCGIEGMRGIPETRELAGVNGGIIVRPILRATKTEILKFCDDNGLEFVTDSTNLENDCTRNRIRHNIIPELVTLFGTPQRAATRLAELATTDAEYLDLTARDFLATTDGEISLSKLNSLHPSIASRVILTAYDRVADTRLEQSHIDAILKLADAGVAHSSISLPCKIAARIDDDRLVFVSDEIKSATQSYSQPLTNGLNVVGNGEFIIFVGDDPQNRDVDIDGVGYSYFSSARIAIDPSDTVTARNRCEGDTIRDNGMTKKVKKILCDKKIALQFRDELPFVCCNEEIAYIPLCAVADRFKAGKNNAFMQITIYKKDTKR